MYLSPKPAAMKNEPQTCIDYTLLVMIREMEREQNSVHYIHALHCIHQWHQCMLLKESFEGVL